MVWSFSARREADAGIPVLEGDDLAFNQYRLSLCGAVGLLLAAHALAGQDIIVAGSCDVVLLVVLIVVGKAGCPLRLVFV